MFKKFDIHDMVYEKEAQCLKCRRNLRCDQHPLKQIKTMHDEDDFDRDV